MIEPKVEIKVDDNKVYQVTLSIDEKGLEDLFISNSRMRGRNYNFYYEKEVTVLFAEEFIKRNYDKLANLIDLDMVKLLATRRLAGMVSKEGSNV